MLRRAIAARYTSLPQEPRHMEAKPIPGYEKVRESWLKTKAAARLIPCTFIGKHLRFSDDDIAGIMKSGARQPVTARERATGHRTA